MNNEERLIRVQKHSRDLIKEPHLSHYRQGKSTAIDKRANTDLISPRGMRGFIYGLGAFMFLIGMSGMADAVTGQGSFAVSVIVFAIGFGISLHNYIYGGN